MMASVLLGVLLTGVAGQEEDWGSVEGPEPEPEPAGYRKDCQPAMMEAEAIRLQDDAAGGAEGALRDLQWLQSGVGVDLLKPPPPPPPLGPPCETFMNQTACPRRCFWYPHHKVCRTYASKPLPCDCPAYQHCHPKSGLPVNKINCMNPYNTCPERCVWNVEQRQCSLLKLPPPPDEINTSNKGALTLIGIFVLILSGIGVMIGLMIKWIEKQEIKARMMALPRLMDPNGDLIAPLNEDGVDEGGEREYRRSDGEYRKGLESASE